VKGLLAHPELPGERDLEAIPLYLTHGYVPCPGTFYSGILSLAPGHRLVATAAGTEGPTPYWSPSFEDGPACDEDEAAERLPHALRRAVARRLVADVPVGAFLSGGLDSSAVVAPASEQASGRVRTLHWLRRRAGVRRDSHARWWRDASPRSTRSSSRSRAP
jgi:asparagine synthase (glutamine-hydrolysing)